MRVEADCTRKQSCVVGECAMQVSVQWVQPRWWPGALVTPPHSSAAALSSSSYFSSFSCHASYSLSCSFVLRHKFHPYFCFPTYPITLPPILLKLSAFCCCRDFLQQKLRMRVDKYRHTYLEARVNWTILPAQSFLQLIPGHYQDTRPRLQIAQ